MNHTLLAFAAVLFLAGTALARDADPTRPPNVIYILADDLGYHELGCYGQAKIRTPNLDRLAREGMRFTRHYSGSPVCAPSRCVLLTGRHTGHAAIRGNKEVGGWGPEEPEGQLPLPAGEVTIAELLRDRGYATGVFGKWGLGGPGSVGHPRAQGFDHFYGYLCQRVAHNYYPTHLWRDHDVDVLHGNRHFRAHQKLAEPLPDEGEYARHRGSDYAPEHIADEAVAFIRGHADEPFFLYYASIIPHVALQAPPDEVDRYPRDWDPEPYLGDRGYLPHPRPRAAYAAMISYLDRNVGRLLDALDELGIADETIVMFSSDNGTTFAGGCDREFFDSLGALRGTKCTVFEGGLRIPMIARWPGRIVAGSITDHVSGFQDVLPTIMELTGHTPPVGLDGISIAPTLLSSGTQRRHDHLYWEYPERDQQQAVMIGAFKGVRTNLRSGDLTIRLYDLDTDGSERHDVAGEHPQLVERMRSIMTTGRTASADFPIPALDADRRTP
ncbi:MAG: arylsulfatase [Planctomycetes bacterium]|nr:arylsulfatase [Planctomycetota bacterium]